MILNLKYGRQQLNIEFPDRTVTPHFTEPAFDISKEQFESDMNQVLPDSADKYTNIAIVVSDKTRLCGYWEYLPWLVDILLNKGTQKDNITFYIAYGTHARQTEEESLAGYGDIYRNFRFIHHNCTDTSVFADCGVTRRGTPVSIRKDILDSSLIITFGSISHHYFAGYGGGRKLLFPGLASKLAIYHNHGLFLDIPNRRLHPKCQPGNLEGNPIAEDLSEIETYMPPRIAIHGILNSSGKVCRLLTGTSYNDFLTACKVHDSYFRYQGNEQFDLVVASAGGYPKDINFIQAHKSVHHAAAFVRDGGKLIMLLECIDKIGSDYFMKYVEAGSFDAAFSMLEKNYEGNGGTALSMMQKAKRIKIFMLTTLDERVCNTLGVTKVTTDDIIRIIKDEEGDISAIANASMLVR